MGQLFLGEFCKTKWIQNTGDRTEQLLAEVELSKLILKGCLEIIFVLGFGLILVAMRFRVFVLVV